MDFFQSIVHVSFTWIIGNGQTISVGDLFAAAPVTGSTIRTFDRLHVCPAGHTAYATYWVVDEGSETHNTAVLQKEGGVWSLVHVQSSNEVPIA